MNSAMIMMAQFGVSEAAKGKKVALYFGGHSIVGLHLEIMDDVVLLGTDQEGEQFQVKIEALTAVRSYPPI